MQIEEAFRDLKSERFGLGFDASRAKRVERIEALLLIAPLALYIAWIIGLCVHAAGHHRRYQANTDRTHPVLSTVYLGRRAWRNPFQQFEPQHYQHAVDSLAACVETHSRGF